jgi:mannose-6-phosphate isomerase
MKDESIRPWGNYEVLLDTPKCKVKRITVKPHQRLSYQYHHKRAERWVVVQGTLTVVLDDIFHTLNYGDDIYIPQGAKHRAWNQTDETVQFIETQIGTYFGEDDIVRLSDDYDRK